MDTTSKKDHWETVYATKSPEQVSWTQKVPEISLAYIRSFGLDKNARIIDIGGGDSKLVDFLVDEGYEHITVLDISEKALDKTRKRLGAKAGKVNWIGSDITEFRPTEQYDIWHDQAAFHFLTGEEQVARYRDIATSCVKGYMIIGTFSTEGPTQCSGLEIKQYDEPALAAVLGDSFEQLRCNRQEHTTPFNTVQHFLFCSFKRRKTTPL